MTPLAIVLFAVGGVATIVVLAVVIVAATDQARATTARFLEARARIEPELAALQSSLADVRERAATLKRTRNGAG